jgi:hypothetical protein
MEISQTLAMLTQLWFLGSVIRRTLDRASLPLP